MTKTFADFQLSPQQVAVTQFLCMGLENKAIAQALNLAEPTVKMHVQRIMKATGCFNRTQVALLFSGVSANEIVELRAENQRLQSAVETMTTELAEVRAQLSGALMVADRIGRGAA